MQVKIKELSAEIELKNTGIELEIRDTSGQFLGDLIISRTQVIWCKGKTKRANGAKLTLQKFIDMMETPEPAKGGARSSTKAAQAKKAAAAPSVKTTKTAAVAQAKAEAVAPKRIVRRKRRAGGMAV